MSVRRQTSFSHMFMLDTIMPRRCSICGSRLAQTERFFCMECIMEFNYTDDFLSPLDNPTARLLWGKMRVERAAALMKYQPHSPFSSAIYRLKYGNCPEIGEDLGRYAAIVGSRHGFFDGIDIIIPLPLNKRREKERGYNQSNEIAYGISMVTKIPVVAHAVRRTRYTKSQTTLSANNRIENMEMAFKLVHPDEISSRHALLVDDIITTGSSIASCGNEILKADNTTLSVMTIGRTTM